MHAKPLTHAECVAQVATLQGWTLDEANRVRATWSFPDFSSALAFVNRVGEVAERANHHPDIELSWGRVQITLYTHSVGGLTALDFALATEIQALTPS